MTVCRHLMVVFVIIGLYSCSEEEDSGMMPEPTETNIQVYTDVVFGTEETNSEKGIFFSTEEGVTYTREALQVQNESEIDFVFYSNSQFSFFINPADTDAMKNFVQAELANARNTKIQSGETVASEVSVDEFEQITTTTELKNLMVVPNEASLLDTFPQLVLFETSTGKKGMIRIKSLTTEQMVADIKLEK